MCYNHRVRTARRLAVSRKEVFMKKIFAVIMAACLMASLLCVTAFAAEETDWGKVNTEEITIDPNVERNEGTPGAWWGTASGTGSMLGNGSLAMIVALLALITSGVSLFLIVDMRKRVVPAATNNAAENESEE